MIHFSVVVAILIKIVGLRDECDRRVEFCEAFIFIKTACNVVESVCVFVLFAFLYIKINL